MLPKKDEIVVCKVERIDPNSVSVKLLEYDVDGFIHISEVASGWVKDIRKYVKEGEIIVAKVRYLTEKMVVLSIKRVTDVQKNEKLKHYKLEQKAKKMLGLCAKMLKKRSTTRIETNLKDQFGSLYEAFKTATTNSEKLNVPKEWQMVIHEVATKSIEKKEYVIKKSVNIYSNEPDGVEHLKKVLMDIKKQGIDIHYVSPPKYDLKFVTVSPKKDRNKIEMVLEKVKSLNSKVIIECDET